MPLAVAHPIGPRGLRVGTGKDFSADTVNQLGQPACRIELLTGINTVEFASGWSRRETVSSCALTPKLIGLHDVKVNQRAAGRLADLDALTHKDRPA